MKILHVNTHDISGGAARAAYRIHKGLQKTGMDSKMLVKIKLSLHFARLEHDFTNYVESKLWVKTAFLKIHHWSRIVV